MKQIVCIVLFFTFSNSIFGQYQIGLIPRESPDKSVFQKVGYTEILITYSSPATKNRKIWGELVPFDTVWRAGANNATTIQFDRDVKIEGQVLKQGKYALFIIPKMNEEWVVIFNSDYNQWGAFNYNIDKDVLRVNITPKSTNKQTEYLKYEIVHKDFQEASIILSWDIIEIEIPIQTYYIEHFINLIEEKANATEDYLKWVVYIQGAEHLENINANMDKAYEWLELAEKIGTNLDKWNPEFYPKDYVMGHLYWIKAKLLANKRKYAEALNYAYKMKSLENLSYYEKRNISENIDKHIQIWKSK